MPAFSGLYSKSRSCAGILLDRKVRTVINLFTCATRVKKKHNNKPLTPFSYLDNFTGHGYANRNLCKRFFMWREARKSGKTVSAVVRVTLFNSYLQ